MTKPAVNKEVVCFVLYGNDFYLSKKVPLKSEEKKKKDPFNEPFFIFLYFRRAYNNKQTNNNKSYSRFIIKNINLILSFHIDS